jgi:malate synthase
MPGAAGSGQISNATKTPSKRRPSVNRVETNGLKISADLHDFIVNEALPGTGVDAGAFFEKFAGLVRDLAPKNHALLAERDSLQEKIDAWHVRHRNQPHDHEAYKAFLEEIGYLCPRAGFRDRDVEVDPEIASVPARSSSCRSPMRALR